MKKIIEIIILIILTVILSVFAMVQCGKLAEKLLLPSDFLFYESTSFIFDLFICSLAVLALIISYSIIYYFKKKITSKEDDYLHIIWLVKSLGKWKIAILFMWVLITYVGFTTFAYVTDDKIVIVEPWNLKGTEYSYSDVKSIETGFGDKKITFNEYEKEGSFYYKITVDGETIVFHQPSVNPDIERLQDTYIELEEFDLALMKYNIPKKSSAYGYKKCDFDKRYVDRFLRIIESE
jgi:hypothetical protein